MKTIILKCYQKNIIHSDDSNDSNNSNEKIKKIKCINSYLKSKRIARNSCFSDFSSSCLKYKKSSFQKKYKNFLCLELESSISRNIRSSHQTCFIKEGVDKISVNFTGKHLCQSLFFSKGAGLACNFIKTQTLVQAFSCEICKISQNILQNILQNTSVQLLLKCFKAIETKKMQNARVVIFTANFHLYLVTQRGQLRMHYISQVFSKSFSDVSLREWLNAKMLLAVSYPEISATNNTFCQK